MKLDNVPGRFAFKALYQCQGKFGWMLSDIYFFDKTEVERAYHSDYTMQIIWPVEVQDGDIIYVPSEDELK